MTISFNAIPADIRTPGAYIEFDNSRALQGLPGQQHRILVIGQRLDSGEVAAQEPTLITGADGAELAFGRGSMLAGMFAALKGANRHTESWAVALDDDGAAVAAGGTITATGPATAAGTIYLYIAGRQVKVGVSDTDDGDAIATAIAAAINARTDLPVTAAVNGTTTNQVDVTARNAGEAGNSIDLRAGYHGERLPAGVDLTFGAMTGGSGNPDVADAISAIGGEKQYHTVVMPYTDATNLTALETELADRWGPLRMIEGHAFAAHYGTHSEGLTLVDGRNSPHLTLMPTGKSPTPPWEWAAAVAGVDAAEPDPARPRQTLQVPGLLPPAEADQFTRAERDILLHDGGATYTVGSSGTIHVERLITTYQENAQGIEDTSYLDITTVRTLAYLRFTWRTRVALKFSRMKLADDGTLYGPGQAVVTPSVMRNELLVLFREWEEAGLVEGFEQFKTDLVVERNGSDPNRVDALLPPDLINQLRVTASQIQFRL